MQLHDIKSPQDIKQLNINELEQLANDIRDFLIRSIAKTGGHLSSNLGIVELSIAMHYVFDSPSDKMIYDVGHQSYVHKILTGRIQEFASLRKYKGISGFQKRCESEHDPWEAGHSSTSLSAALGMCVARDLNHEDYHVLPIIGDGALTGGMALEALNHIGELQSKMIIIFNDNHMSISQNVGGMNKNLTKLRTSLKYNSMKDDIKTSLSKNNLGKNVLKVMTGVKNSIKDNVVDHTIFSQFNIDYLGPVDGHNIAKLIEVLKIAKKRKGPLVLHVLTDKGKGYCYAQEDQSGAWHGVSPFDIETGRSLTMMPKSHKSWSEVISDSLVQLAKQNEDIVAITPAMISGSKLNNFFEAYPNRSFDCGIAEEHAMCFAAALAQSKKRPFISVYSSFLQRCYDQINHDIARMNLNVVIGIDRAGLVGEDGETHHGIYDIALLRHIPNMVITQPKNAHEARNLLYTAFNQQAPFAIRYPRGHVPYRNDLPFELIEIGSWESYNDNDTSEICVITYGDVVDKIVMKAKSNELDIMVVNARFIKPLDYSMLDHIFESNKQIIVFEQDCKIGGLSSAVCEYANDVGYYENIRRIGIDDHFVVHGSISQLKKVERIDINYLFQVIEDYLCD